MADIIPTSFLVKNINDIKYPNHGVVAPICIICELIVPLIIRISVGDIASAAVRKTNNDRPAKNSELFAKKKEGHSHKRRVMQNRDNTPSHLKINSNSTTTESIGLK